jgi:hypothetical protein
MRCDMPFSYEAVAPALPKRIPITTPIPKRRDIRIRNPKTWGERISVKVAAPMLP